MQTRRLSLADTSSDMTVCHRTLRSLAVVMAVAATVAACSTNGPPRGTASSSPVAPPPAVSGVDHTVAVKWSMADSFDILPDGTCAGRGDNRGMNNGARLQLQGDTTGFTDETRVTARFRRATLSKKEALMDDGQYCVVEGVFAPSMPDPGGYSIKFSGTRIHIDHLGKPGSGTPFGRPDPPPGYGVYNISTQRCPSLLDPPDKDCSD
ncbi:hypothetical protein [Mycolicibacterium aromaticivorans]|nr:hypothetical protein [Mycolicibacterium aromaticivorans]